MPSKNGRRIFSSLIATEKTQLIISRNRSKTYNVFFHNGFNRLYDIFTITITLIDFITDILLLSQFYYCVSTSGMTFFWLSFSFILLTHICYVILMLSIYPFNHSHIILFIFLLPISPVLPYILYFLSYENPKICYIAFIIESVCESIPLSIIQIIALSIKLNGINNIYILYVSLAFSLLSIVCKSITILINLTHSQKIYSTISVYQWLCFITDFYLIFFINTPLIISYKHFQYLYMLKIEYLISPLVLCILLLLMFEFKNHTNYCLYLPLFIIVMLILLIISEFMLFSWIALFVYVFFNRRYKWLRVDQIFWNKIVQWLFNSNDIIKRLFVVNYILSQTTESRWVKQMFIDFSSFMAINGHKIFDNNKRNKDLTSLSNLRNQFKDYNGKPAPTMIQLIINNYIQHIINIKNLLTVDKCSEGILLIFYFLIYLFALPLYFLSRIITLLYLFYFIIFFHVSMFSLITIAIFGLFILILIILIIGIKIYKTINILWHILPGRQKLIKSLMVDKTHINYLSKLNSMYNFHMNKPKILNILSDTFSNDIGRIILHYLPKTYYEQCKSYKNRKRNNYKSYGYDISHSQSSSPHLQIDCVAPLPPVATYNAINTTPSMHDENINLSIAPFVLIPNDCNDPLSLLKSNY